MITELLIAAGALIGAGVGGYQSNKRAGVLAGEAAQAKDEYEYLRKRAQANKRIAENDLRIEAIRGTQANREANISAFQTESIGEARAAASGTSAGTAYAKGETDAALARTQARETEQISSLSLEGKLLGMQAQVLADKAAISRGLFALQSAEEEANYAQSAFAMATGILTGAVTGAQVAAGVAQGATAILGMDLDDAAKIAGDAAMEGLAKGREAIANAALPTEAPVTGADSLALLTYGRPVTRDITPGDFGGSSINITSGVYGAGREAQFGALGSDTVWASTGRSMMGGKDVTGWGNQGATQFGGIGPNVFTPWDYTTPESTTKKPVDSLIRMGNMAPFGSLLWETPERVQKDSKTEGLLWPML